MSVDSCESFSVSVVFQSLGNTAADSDSQDQKIGKEIWSHGPCLGAHQTVTVTIPVTYTSHRVKAAVVCLVSWCSQLASGMAAS